MEQDTAPAGRRGRKSALFAEKPKAKVEPVVLAEEGTESVESSRQAMRPDMREESPLARAARRAAEIKGSGGLEFDGTDEYYIDPRIIPEGWSYEWKREAVYGQRDDTYQQSLKQSGWEEVPYSRHPDKFPKGKGNTIERKGMLLMERPAVITDEMRRKDNMNARNAVESRKQTVDSTKGMLGRADSYVAPKITQGYEPMIPPK